MCGRVFLLVASPRRGARLPTGRLGLGDRYKREGKRNLELMVLSVWGSPDHSWDVLERRIYRSWIDDFDVEKCVVEGSGGLQTLSGMFGNGGFFDL